jgi:hypothetical protein
VRISASAALLVFAAAIEAAAQPPGPEAPICLAKTERTGGRLGFIVNPSDAPTFEKVGFERIACPELLEQAARSLAARCVRFRALDDPGRRMLEELYGLTVEQMCAATDSWVATQTSG